MALKGNSKVVFWRTLIVTLIVISFLIIQNRIVTDKYIEVMEKCIDYKNITDRQIEQMQKSLLVANNNNWVLSNELNSLNYSHSSLLNSYEALDADYDGLKSEIDLIIKKVEDFEDELNDSISWFSKNSVIKDIPNEKRIKSSLDGRCYEIAEDSCHVKLGCFYLINSKNLNFKYKYDASDTGKEDKLLSLYEFVHNWGGDCEDYSLFYKAEYNHVMEKCYENRAYDIVLEAWNMGGNSDYFLDFDNEWYISGAKSAYLPKGYIYPNIICGNIYDINSKEISGHCVIAFTDKEITETAHIGLLKSSPVVEPQNGIYMGRINDESSGIYLSEEGISEESSIWMVITDSDLFLYSKKHRQWLGYSMLLHELNFEKENLLDLLN